MKKKIDLTEEQPSKSELKRQMTALQKVGQILVELPAAQLALIPLEPRLAEAIEAARSIKSHEGKRRQLQYIGKLMRHVDPAPIQEALNKIQLKDQQGKAKFHQIERWRDALISEGDDKLQEFVQQFPHADTQQLRQLIRKAKQALGSTKSAGIETELFRFLRTIIEANHEAQ